jgi:methylated-DNA-protein-cysteine methyltransferase-like protein
MSKRAVSGSVSTHQTILAVVRRIPRGRVATYGQIAALAGLVRQPRLVGYALHALPVGTRVPWHRVINARGMVSIRSDGVASLSQRFLLEREGVEFDGRGRVSLERYQWRPTRAGARSRVGRASPTSRSRR